MATKDAADALQTDQQLSETDEDAVRAAVDGALMQVHTCLPGVVKSFNAAKQTAVVQATIKRQYVGKDPEALPLCVDVPVVFPSGGAFVFTMPVTAGDECLLMFSERAIDYWWDRGGVQEAADHRFHDLSDAFALVGVSSRPRFISGVSTDAAELRKRDGSLRVRIDGDRVTVSGTPPTPPFDVPGVAAFSPPLAAPPEPYPVLLASPALLTLLTAVAGLASSVLPPDCVATTLKAR